MAVAIRDPHSLVSEHGFPYCHASHIVPYSREVVSPISNSTIWVRLSADGFWSPGIILKPFKYASGGSRTDSVSMPDVVIP